MAEEDDAVVEDAILKVHVARVRRAVADRSPSSQACSSCGFNVRRVSDHHPSRSPSRWYFQSKATQVL